MNLSGIKRLRVSHRILFPVLMSVLAMLLIGGSVLAAVTVIRSYSGSVTVVGSGGSGGGGGGGTPPLIYTFEVYDATTNGNIVTDTFWNFGTMNVGYSYERTVYIQNTGNQPLSVDAVVVWSGEEVAGLFTGLDAVSVPVSSDRVAMPIKFTAGAAVTTSIVTFTISFNETH